MNFNQHKNSYSNTIEKSLAFTGQEHDFYMRVKADYLHKVIQDYLPHIHQPALLDVGCGHGLIHKHIKTQNIKITGVEVADEVLELARVANPDIEYISHDGKILPFEACRFDVVMAICVMHHVVPEHWASFLNEIHRVLKPGGIIVIFEHNPLNPFTRYIVANNPLDEDAVLLPSRRLNSMLSNRGFISNKIRYILFTPFSNGLFRWIDNIFGRCPLGAQYYATAIKS